MGHSGWLEWWPSLTLMTLNWTLSIYIYIYLYIYIYIYIYTYIHPGHVLILPRRCYHFLKINVYRNRHDILRWTGLVFETLFVLPRILMHIL